MEVFVRVAECGSFSRAAESLDLANATVTTCVRNLERLISKICRKVVKEVLTKAGDKAGEKTIKVTEKNLEKVFAPLVKKKSRALILCDLRVHKYKSSTFQAGA